MKVRELDVWYYGLDEWSLGRVAWADVPSEMREQLQVGDRLVITNQSGDAYVADIVDLEPCRSYGIYLEVV